jgi:SNF2 family DNA or RNA helicase
MNVIVSKANRALLVPPKDGLEALFPDAPLLPGGNGARIVQHGLRETLMLRHLGYEVPNPLDYYYDWAGAAARGKPPYAVQRSTARMMVEHPKAYVLNDMGTGKTKTALWAWDFLNKCGFAGKLLVVCPLSTMKFVWAREVFDTLPGRKVQVLHGTKQKRLDALAIDADVYVINHKGVEVIGQELFCRADITALVIDELAVYRNNSGRSKHMRKFARKFEFVWGMTGTPMPQEPTDVWAQCMIVSPNRVPQFRSHARDLLMTRASQHIWKAKPDAVERALSWMQPSCRYALNDVTELPEVVSRAIDVPLSQEQEVAYKRVSTSLVAMVKNKQITAVNAGVAMNKLLQVAGGWVYTNNPEFVRLDPSPRVVALADLIESAPEKVLVAIPYRHMIEGISKIFKMKGVEIDHCMVHGDIHNREDLFNRFQNTNEFKAMLADPRCVHHGLTLTRASTIIWYLPVLSLDVYKQFNARITRIGQKNKQQVVHMQGTPVERRSYKLLRDHEKIQDAFLELVENATADAI